MPPIRRAAEEARAIDEASDIAAPRLMKGSGQVRRKADQRRVPASLDSTIGTSVTMSGSVVIGTGHSSKPPSQFACFPARWGTVQ